MRKNYIGQIIGDFKIKELVMRRNYIAIYKAICTKCYNEKIAAIWTIKHSCTCNKCKKAITDQQKFNLVKNKQFKEYIVADYTYKKNWLYYLVKCNKCGITRWIKSTQLENIPHCTCHHHTNGKLIAKHNNEKVGNYILTDTGQNAYNTRNRLYKATCTCCGRTKYGQYSDFVKHDLCICKNIK